MEEYANDLSGQVLGARMASMGGLYDAIARNPEAADTIVQTFEDLTGIYIDPYAEE